MPSVKDKCCTRVLTTIQLRQSDVKRVLKLKKYVNTRTGRKRSALLRALVRIGLEGIGRIRGKDELQFLSQY
jgi:hypothetical protein